LKIAMVASGSVTRIIVCKNLVTAQNSNNRQSHADPTMPVG
jgi:hypothetical protein